MSGISDETAILGEVLHRQFGKPGDPQSIKYWRHVAERIEAGDRFHINQLRNRVGPLEGQPWEIRRLMLMIQDIEQAALGEQVRNGTMPSS